MTVNNASMDFPLELLQNQEKKAAHLRRGSKFIEWLHDPSYGYINYVDHTSNERLAKMISKLVIWALEMSMPQQQWRVYHRKFNKISKTLMVAADELKTTEEQHYLRCVRQLHITLLDYKKHIETIYT